MDATTRKKINNKNDDNQSLSVKQLIKSRFFFFVLGFVALIIISNNYSKKTESYDIARNSEINGKIIKSNYVDKKESLNSGKKTSSSKSIEDNIVSYALELIGTPYTEAGKVPSTGFDCSGFTSHVYKNFGFEIPPSSATQSEFGEEQDLSSARKGDLIFFKSPTIGNNNIGHVGIIISTDKENIEFVHSSSRRGVVVDNLGSKHYSARFRSIRRVL